MNVTMRDAFLDRLYDIARQDRQVIFISNDFGAPSLDKFREDLADQFIHIGIAEQNMVNVATGLTMAGKIVYLYSIAPFLPLRCYEQLRVHLSFKGHHVTSVMVGAGYSYDLSGPTHQALEDIAIMSALPGMTVLSGSDSIMGAAFARITYENPGPYYVRFDREILPTLYNEKEPFSDGLTLLEKGQDLTIVTTGIMAHRALEIAGELKKNSIVAGIVDLYRIKPLNADKLIKSLTGSGRVVTLEESFADSGIGSVVSNSLSDAGKDYKLLRIGTPNRYYPSGRSRSELHRLSGLDKESVTRKILSWLKEL